MSLEPDRNVQIYEGTLLERIDPKVLVIPEAVKRGRFFLASDIIVGNYGVIGFVLVDSKPEVRWVTYTDPEWEGVTYAEDSFRDDPRDKAHFLNTDLGFKMVRYFALPPEVRGFFARDKFLGDPLIDKCCREGTLVEDFDEEPAITGNTFIPRRDDNQDIRGLIYEIINSANQTYGVESLRRYDAGISEHAYVSFHRWWDLKNVLAEGERSVLVAIHNFDTLLERFDTKCVLIKRNLQLPADLNNFPQLPPGG